MGQRSDFCEADGEAVWDAAKKDCTYRPVGYKRALNRVRFGARLAS